MEEEYKIQKWRVQDMVREAVEKYELELKEEIERGDRGGKMLWKNINKLRGRETRREEKQEVYREGKRVEEGEAAKLPLEACKEICSMRENKMREVSRVG